MNSELPPYLESIPYTYDLLYSEELGCFFNKDEEAVNVDLTTINNRRFRDKIIEDRKRFIERLFSESIDDIEALSEASEDFIEWWVEVCEDSIWESHLVNILVNIGRLLLLAASGSLIIIATFWIYPLITNKFKAVNYPKWTGLSESITIEETRNRKDKIGSFTETKKYQSGKTLWNWLELSSMLAVPVLIAILGYQFQKRDKEKIEQQAKLERKRAEQQAKLELKIANDNLSESAIQVYLDSMEKLLLDKEHRKQLLSYNKSYFLNEFNPTRNIARIRTVTILRRLENDTDRQARILHFLHDADLTRFILKNVNLQGANLKDANLNGANMLGANLSSANLHNIHLREANLKRVNLHSAYLKGANLWGANLSEANLSGEVNLSEANLSKAILSDAFLWKVNMSGAILDGAILSRANLWDANLSEANLSGATLDRAFLLETNLDKANMSGVNLKEANLSGASLSGANLSGANLSGAIGNLTHKQIKSACLWEDAIYKEEEKENQKYIQDLKRDKSSDPEIAPDCTIWKRLSGSHLRSEVSIQ